MEIVINPKGSVLSKKTGGMRKKIAEMNSDKVVEFLKLHKLPVSNSLEENCKRVAKQYEISRLAFNKKKQTGMTPQKFANFEDTEVYDELLERNFDEMEQSVGFSGWETNFSDFRNFNEGLGAEFENFNVGKLLQSAKGLAQKAGTAIKAGAGKVGELAKKGVAMAKTVIKSQTGLGGGGEQQQAEYAQDSQIVNQVPNGQRVIYQDNPLATVRQNVVAVGTREWLNDDRQKAIEKLIRKGKEDEERSRIKAQLVALGVDPKRFTNFVGEDFDIGKAKQTISDVLTGVVEGEKAKATMSAMPKIILLVAGGLVAGYLVAKYA